MAGRCDNCLVETLKWEGGYSNHPKDPGGATMKGVTQRVYDGYRSRRGLPIRAVHQIENREVVEIYEGSYWAAVRGDELPSGVDLAVFDLGVNSGPSRAIRELQQALRLKDDGHFGEATLAAVQAADAKDLIAKIMTERRNFLRSLSTFSTFGKGWMNRCAGVENAALAMVGVSAPVMAFAAPLENIDAQSATQGRAIEAPVAVHQEAHAELKQISTPYSIMGMGMTALRWLGLGGTGGVVAKKALEGGEAAPAVNVVPLATDLLGQVGAAAQIIKVYGLPNLFIALCAVLLLEVIRNWMLTGFMGAKKS